MREKAGRGVREPGRDQVQKKKKNSRSKSLFSSRVVFSSLATGNEDFARFPLAASPRSPLSSSPSLEHKGAFVSRICSVSHGDFAPFMELGKEGFEIASLSLSLLLLPMLRHACRLSSRRVWKFAPVQNPFPGSSSPSPHARTPERVGSMRDCCGTCGNAQKQDILERE